MGKNAASRHFFGNYQQYARKKFLRGIWLNQIPTTTLWNEHQLWGQTVPIA
jgi:hypothetical protein